MSIVIRFILSIFKPSFPIFSNVLRYPYPANDYFYILINSVYHRLLEESVWSVPPTGQTHKEYQKLLFLLIRSDTTLADVRKFCEECQRRWGTTPLQIFLHKDEGHWQNGQPEAEDKESFQISGKWFKPNYHAHIVFDWMNHDTGKSRKLNDEDMAEMQTLAADFLSMKRGKSKAETGSLMLQGYTGSIS